VELVGVVSSISLPLIAGSGCRRGKTTKQHIRVTRSVSNNNTTEASTSHQQQWFNPFSEVNSLAVFEL